MNKCLLSPEREPVTDQRKDTPTYTLVSQWVLWSYRSRKDSSVTIAPCPPFVMKAGDMVCTCTAQLADRWHPPSSRWLWSEPRPSGPVCLNSWKFYSFWGICVCEGGNPLVNLVSFSPFIPSFLASFLSFWIIILCIWVFESLVCLCTTSMPSVHKVQRRVSHLLRLGLHLDVSYSVSAGNRIWVLYKSHKFS